MYTNEEDPIADHAAEAAQKIAMLLIKEGERGAVLLGAARVDSSLEKLLKSVMSPHPDKDDNLFQSDRPLGSFSSKISLAFRLSLIDKHVEHSLQMIRKVRNDFAHSFESESLGDQSHRNRLAAPISYAKNNPLWPGLQSIMANLNINVDYKHYVMLIVILVAFIEAAAQLQTEFKPLVPVRFTRDDPNQA